MPVPYIVLSEEIINGTIYHFKINDDFKVEHCIKNKLCSICGKELHDDMWLIGGPISAFQSHAFIDSPVHKQCGIYALKNCPYMVYSKYNSKTEQGVYVDPKLNILCVNPTQTSDRVPYFAFVKISGFDVKRSIQRLIKPHLPYLEIEKWNDGKLIT
jgi:hypothetical protein